MKKISFLLATFLTSATFAQNSKKGDAVYQQTNEVCNTSYKNSTLKIKDTAINFIRFRSDSGNILVDLANYESILDRRIPKGLLTSTGTRVDSMLNYLFANDLLTYDKLLQSAKKDRFLVSQYGDSFKYNLDFNKSDIIILEVVYLTPEKRSYLQNVHVRIYMKENPRNVHNFVLTLRTTKKVGTVERLLSESSKIDCISYRGYDVELKY